MPLNVRRFCSSVLLVLISFFVINAQTSADIMRERVGKAKAFIAVKNYNAAIYELENIRRETSDPTVHSVINVLLMNSYLEQGDYKRAQDFLTELSNPKKINQTGGVTNYSAVAGQVIRGARSQLERYRALGLSVLDRNLPTEAATDIQKMRETLELVVEQSKVFGKDKDKTAGAMTLLEEATSARSNLAKDDYDANRWKNEAADARELIASSRSVVINAVVETPPETNGNPQNTVASNNPTPDTSTNSSTVAPITTPIMLPVGKQPIPTDKSKVAVEPKPTAESTTKTDKSKEEVKKTDNKETAVSDNPAKSPRERRVENKDTETASDQNKPDNQTVPVNAGVVKDNSPLVIGSLVEYATSKPSPVYPPTAKTLRMTGVVRIELEIDEDGQVSKVQNTSGPSLLQRAATDAVRKWKFKPFVRNGEPVKAMGFVSFNFNL